MNSSSTAFSPDDEYSCLYKIVLVGDTGVGKTNLVHRYIKGTLPKYSTPTIGVEFATKTVSIGQGVKVKASIWDTAGQERYRAITSAHYRRAEGALLVYDVTKEKSFESVQRWLEELKAQADPDVVIMLVGNKVDLCDKNPAMRKVSKDEAKNMAKDYKMMFEETSAVTAQNTSEVFERLLKEIYDRKGGATDKGKGLRLDVDGRQKASSGGCC